MGNENTVVKSRQFFRGRTSRRLVVAVATTGLLATLVPAWGAVGSGDPAPVHVQQLFADPALEGGRFGTAASLDGSTLAVGSPGTLDFTGEAFVFRRSQSGVWSLEARVAPPNGEAFDGFGAELAVSGSTMVVASPGRDDAGAASGAVYVFRRRPDGSWRLAQTLLPPDPGIGLVFGSGLGFDGNLLVVGAPGVDDKGAAYVYKRAADGSLVLSARLDASDGAEFDDFGWAADLSETTVVVGSFNARDGEGAAYVFRRIADGEWEEVAILRPDPADERGFFGDAVAIDRGTVLVTEPTGAGIDRGTGAVYVFTVDEAGSWDFTSKLVDPQGAQDDEFGIGLDVDGDIAVVGAYLSGAQGEESGSAFVFRRFPDGSWRLVAKVLPPEIAAGDRFGFSAEVDGSTAVFGAPSDDDAAIDAGSASVYDLRF